MRNEYIVVLGGVTITLIMMLAVSLVKIADWRRDRAEKVFWKNIRKITEKTGRADAMKLFKKCCLLSERYKLPFDINAMQSAAKRSVQLAKGESEPAPSPPISFHGIGGVINKK